MKRTAFFALLLPIALALSADPRPGPGPGAGFTGTWRWKFTMPDGTEASPKIKLMQEGDKLSGTSSVRGGTATAITNGVVTGNELRFEVVRRQHGVAVTTRYSGKLDGNVVRGRVESDWAGQPQSYPWEARRYSGIEGTWNWSVPFGARNIDVSATFRLDGDKLTGSMPRREGRPTEIKKASFKNGEVVFEVERGRGEARFLSKYQGILDGDTIKGEIETMINNTPFTNDWDAVRAD